MSRHAHNRANVHDLLAQFGKEEEAFLSSEFLAPSIRGGVVCVRVAGAVCRLRIKPASFTGWGVFRPTSHRMAQLSRQATLAERRDYLRLFPAVRLVAVQRDPTGWNAAAGNFGDNRFRLDGLAPVALAEEVRQFDNLRVRYDGLHFWFEELDARQDPSIAPFLREALSRRTAPEQVQRRGLTAEQRAAYDLAYWMVMQPATPSDRHERSAQADWLSASECLLDDPTSSRLRTSLSHAGAELVDYVERSDGYRVSFTVEGRRYTSSIDKQDFTVQLAGICLSGEDKKFDLGSLVGVVRQANQNGEIVRVGGDGALLDEGAYWAIHPER